ncbi:D-alanine--D-alanine ligase [Persephonella sp.]
MSELKVALVYGGSSSEREISIKSGKAVKKSLQRLGINHRDFDPVKPVEFVNSLVEYSPDVVFNLLHGRGGEDGTIQGLFETLGLKYTGSPVKASALAMDKGLTKEIIFFEDVPTPEWRVIEKPEELEDWEIFPAVVKPNSEGSSIGVAIVKNPDQLVEAVKKASVFDSKVLVEEFIQGREVTVGILNGMVLPPVEIVVKDGFYDYENKYVSSETEYIVFPQMDEEIRVKLEEYSLKIYRKLGCRGAARIDYIISDRPYFLEINTIPGMTDHSLLPKAARAAGIDFDSLVLKIIEEAVNGE